MMPESSEKAAHTLLTHACSGPATAVHLTYPALAEAKALSA